VLVGQQKCLHPHHHPRESSRRAWQARVLANSSMRPRLDAYVQYQRRQAQNQRAGRSHGPPPHCGRSVPYPPSATSCSNSLPISLQSSRELLRHRPIQPFPNTPRNTSHEMAKGLRASRTKKNNQALSKRVFGPVEAARNERLSAKLLALAQQPKAPKAEMEIEKLGMHTRHHVSQSTTSDKFTTDSTDSGAAAEGTPSLSIPIPKSIVFNDHHHQLLTPPSTPPTSNNTPANPILDRAGQEAMAREQLFYHLLGASSDILGFDEGGDLHLAFNTSATSHDT
jgi:hypothetical protein